MTLRLASNDCAELASRVKSSLCPSNCVRSDRTDRWLCRRYPNDGGASNDSCDPELLDRPKSDASGVRGAVAMLKDGRDGLYIDESGLPALSTSMLRDLRDSLAFYSFSCVISLC